jgi:DNA-binding CsgD family transcriptional regulator
LTRAAAEYRPFAWFDPNRATAEALVLSRRGLPSEARRVLATALDQSRETGNVAVGLYQAVMASRVEAPDLAADYLRPMVDGGTVDGPLPAVLLHQAEALVARNVDGMLLVADELEAGGLYINAVETLAVAADIEQDAGRSRTALATRARALRLAERCPGVDLRFLDRPVPSAGLTARELEVARLAATGLSSADLATRLHLSVRTVDTHLGRVYLKLGVAGRAELRNVPQLQVGSQGSPHPG